MRFMSKRLRLLALAASCVALGAGVSAIATAGAASTTPAAHRATSARGAGVLSHLRALKHVVQGSVVVATKTGFATVTFERGRVQSVSGRQLTLVEGTKKTHRTVTLTIPGGAVVRDNGASASLGQLSAGLRAIVVTAPKQTYVVAHTPR